MDTLFSQSERKVRRQNAPLAARMRPRSLEEYVGQEQAVGPDSWLRRAIEHDTLSSVILYGPAGTGKTTLARIIANGTHGMTGWKADLMAVAIAAIPNTLFLIYQFGTLETVGVAPFPHFGLYSIVCEAFECTLVALAIIQRRITAKTGNIWTGVFVNTFLFGIVAVASTCCYRF